MINDLKLGYGALRYTFNLKGNIITAVVMFVVGTLISLLSSLNTYLGGFFIMIAGMMPTQMLYSLDITGLVLSSPARKRMQTSIPAVCSLVSMVGVYLVFAVIKGLCVLRQPQMLSYHCGDLVAAAVCGAIMLLYMGAVFKYFWGPTILFFITYSIISKEILLVPGESLGQSVVPFAIVILLGIVILMVGALLSYLLSLLVYKKPISKMSQSANLRKYM